jgi:hypothetical protein
VRYPGHLLPEVVAVLSAQEQQAAAIAAAGGAAPLQRRLGKHTTAACCRRCCLLCDAMWLSPPCFLHHMSVVGCLPAMGLQSEPSFLPAGPGCRGSHSGGF